MNSITPAIRELAQWLLASEAARDPTGDQAAAVVRTIDKVRTPLAKFAGVAGFRSLLLRAKALAAVDVPWLEAVPISKDGRLEGFDGSHCRDGPVKCGPAGAVLIAQLLGLLVAFIGEPLTLQLVREAWPEAAAPVADRGAEEQP